MPLFSAHQRNALQWRKGECLLIEADIRKWLRKGTGLLSRSWVFGTDFALLPQSYAISSVITWQENNYAYRSHTVNFQILDFQQGLENELLICVCTDELGMDEIHYNPVRDTSCVTGFASFQDSMRHDHHWVPPFHFKTTLAQSI